VSTFGRREVLRGICQAVGGGGSVAEVERLADQLLEGNQQVVPVGVWSGGRLRGLLPVDQRCYSTRELLAVEADLLARGVRGLGQGAGVVPVALVEATLTAHGGLAGEQADLVRALTSSGDGVQVVNAKAGAGKTFALRAARVAWEQAGDRVVGAALAARAARELQEQAGIASGTIARLLADLGDPRCPGLDARTVLVVDEAGMIGTRTLARLIGHVERAGAKVVLCGDAAQLPEIDAGGGFRGLCRRLGAVELQGNRRQRQAWERQALDALRRGDAVAALVAYLGHGRVVLRRRADPLRRKLVADWWQASGRPGEQPSVMLAARRVDVADLNARARILMAANGRLGPDSLRVGEREFAVGDRVVALRNAHQLGVLNGTRGTVVGSTWWAGRSRCAPTTAAWPTCRAGTCTPRAAAGWTTATP
jgi:ATP-dependent exoDNAse (exonuclease V) alpha subunit